MLSQGTQRILGAIYAFMGVGFVAIINLFFFGYRFSQDTPFAFMRLRVKTYSFILSLTKVQKYS